MARRPELPGKTNRNAEIMQFLIVVDVGIKRDAELCRETGIVDTTEQSQMVVQLILHTQAVPDSEPMLPDDIIEVIISMGIVSSFIFKTVSLTYMVTMHIYIIIVETGRLYRVCSEESA